MISIGGTTAGTMLPLSNLDKALIVLQVAMGMVYVTWKRNIHFLRTTIDGGRRCSMFDFQNLVPESRLSNEDAPEEDSIFFDETTDLIHEIDMFCYLIP